MCCSMLAATDHEATGRLNETAVVRLQSIKERLFPLLIFSKQTAAGRTERMAHDLISPTIAFSSDFHLPTAAGGAGRGAG